MGPLRGLFYAVLIAGELAAQTGAVAPSYGPLFLWGTAISAHQVEGVFGGGQFGDWWLFEHTDHHIANGDTADLATDHWHRYPEDLSINRSLGLNTLRISIAWEKVEPAMGVFDGGVVAHYRAELEAIRSLGMRPLVTLLHGTTPLWFEARGGWTAADSEWRFLTYVEYVVAQLRDLCDLWATINEPMVLIGDGYFLGSVPPQIKSTAASIQAFRNMAAGHRLATARIHELQPVAGPQRAGLPLRGVGLVNSLDVYDPYDRADPQDVLAAGLIRELSNWAFPKAAVYGDSNVPLPTQPQGSGGSPVIDWFGVNYYTRWLVRHDPNGFPSLIVPDGPQADNGSVIYPPGMERILRDSAAQFPGIPLVVTENGVADVADRYRPWMIRDTLHYLDLAKFGHDGSGPVDVRGYYHWSLTDNFEWQYGYQYRFGLIGILYGQGLKRVPRLSAAVYRDEVLARR